MKEVLEYHRVGLKGDMNHLKNLLAHIARETFDRKNPDSLPDWIRKDWEPDGLHRNGTPAAEALGAREKILTGLKRRPQSNGCTAFEFIVSAGEGFPPEKWYPYFEEAKNFLCKRYGMENLISAAIHTDEKTPHMHLVFVPVITFSMKDGTTERRYSASDYLEDGGSLLDGEGTSAAVAGKDRMKLKKAALVQLHTDFNEAVGKKFGLERGEEGSRASHMDLKEYHRREKEYLRELDEKDRNIRQIEKEVIEERDSLVKAKNEFSEQESFLRGELDKRNKVLSDKETELNNRENALDDRDRDLSAREAKLAEQEANFEKNVKFFKEKDTPTTKEEETIDSALREWSLYKNKNIPYRPANIEDIMKAINAVIKYFKNKIYYLEHPIQISQNRQITKDNDITR